ncbi:MAG: discoidin domain-containing protein [Phycisphaerae bacterium]|nr:discoidin domain-containing protein [Phycisphaerae bacterium]
MNEQNHAPSGEGSGGGGPILVIALGAVIILAAIGLALTVKTQPVEGPPTPTPVTPATTTNGQKPSPGGAAAEVKLVQLPLDLPNPVFDGTPAEIPKGVRIDKKRHGKKRPPFMAPDGLTNVALGKTVTSSDPEPIIGSLDLVTDEDKEALDGSYVELAPGKQWLQIDLGAEHEIFAITIWHNHMNPRVYRDVVVQVSNDPKFEKDVVTVYNNDHDNSSGFGVGEHYEYFESDEGMLVNAMDKSYRGKKARYLRCWSSGSTSGDQNEYGEVEAWAFPLKK